MRRKLIFAKFGARCPRKKTEIPSTMTKKTLAWAKVVQKHFVGLWSKGRNISFTLINQLNSSC